MILQGVDGAFLAVNQQRHPIDPAGTMHGSKPGLEACCNREYEFHFWVMVTRVTSEDPRLGSIILEGRRRQPLEGVPLHRVDHEIRPATSPIFKTEQFRHRLTMKPRSRNEQLAQLVANRIWRYSCIMAQAERKWSLSQDCTNSSTRLKTQSKALIDWKYGVLGYSKT